MNKKPVPWTKEEERMAKRLLLAMEQPYRCFKSPHLKRLWADLPQGSDPDKPLCKDDLLRAARFALKQQNKAASEAYKIGFEHGGIR